MQLVANKASVPNGGFFVYRDPDSGLELKHPYYEQLERNARNHRKANNFPLGANWSQQFEDNVCTNTPTAPCHEQGIAKKAVQAVLALAKWAKAGMPVVSDEEYTRREGICYACEHFTGKVGLLKIFCKKCGCSKKKLAMASEACPIGKW